MNIDTKHFGAIDIIEENILTFPEGLPGFENEKSFILVGEIEEGFPFQWLQSINKTDLAFVVVRPYDIMPNYDIDIDDKEVEILKIMDVSNVVVYCIVVVPEEIVNMTANLKAPLLVNTENNQCKQVMMGNCDYEVKYKIFDKVGKKGGC